MTLEDTGRGSVSGELGDLRKYMGAKRRGVRRMSKGKPGCRTEENVSYW